VRYYQYGDVGKSAARPEIEVMLMVGVNYNF
jgi:hypothetical protein